MKTLKALKHIKTIVIISAAFLFQYQATANILTASALATQINAGAHAPKINVKDINNLDINSQKILENKALYLIFVDPYNPIGVDAAKAINTQYGDRISVVAFTPAMNTDIRDAKALAASNQIDFSVVFDSNNQYIRQFKGWNQPTQVIIGQDGIIKFYSQHAQVDIDAAVKLYLAGDNPMKVAQQLDKKAQATLTQQNSAQDEVKEIFNENTTDQKSKPIKKTVSLAFNAQTIDGQLINYDPKKATDKPMVIFFSDSLCPFHHLPNCEAKIDAFNQVKNKYADRANWLQVVKGYYVDENSVKSYMERFKLTLPSIWDTDNTLFSKYKVYANPYVVVINTNGEISYRSGNFIDELGTILMAQQ